MREPISRWFVAERVVTISGLYKPNFICYDKIIVELKAATEIAREREAQVFNYLEATGLKLGLIVNFGHYPKAQVKRIIL